MPRTPARKIVQGQKVLKTSPDATVSKAAKLMGIRRVGAIAVVRDDCLLGILTERDILTRVVALERDPETTRVVEVMTPNPQTASPEEPIGEILSCMRRNGYRHMPVVENGKVIGVVSLRTTLPTPAPRSGSDD